MCSQVAGEESGNTAYAFLTRDRDVSIHPGRGVKKKGLMVDAGATSHIITGETMFKSFDENLGAKAHVLSSQMEPSVRERPSSEVKQRCA